MQWDINLEGKDIIEVLGLNDEGRAQERFTSSLRKRSSKYVPNRSGILEESAYFQNDISGIIYTSPYARYLWYGKLMVDPVTQKGAFTDGFGKFWSRPKVSKILDPKNRNLNFDNTKNSLAGSFWVERCWNIEKEEIINEIVEVIHGK